MSEKLDRQWAEAEAGRVLEEHHLTDPPISPFVIAEAAGIAVTPKVTQEPGVSGFLMRVGDNFGICYARHLSNQGFVRFTVAHELGHYFLPGHPQHLFPPGVTLHKSRDGFTSPERYEREADFFATGLLMPAESFGKAMESAGEGLAAVLALSSLFRTSLTATAIRYSTLSDRMVAVVMSSANRVEYCFMSDRLRELRALVPPKKGDMLARQTATAVYNKEPRNVAGCVRSDGVGHLDDWFDGAPDIEVVEEVVGLGKYAKTLTVVSADANVDPDEWNADDE